MTSSRRSDRPTVERGRASGPVDGHLLAAVDDDRRSAVVARLARNLSGPTTVGGASFHCVLLRRGRLPVVIAETDIAPGADRWEYRTSALWVEVVAESPATHWSYGLEGFGLAIDRPDELLDRGYGHRNALGWELDFESDRAQLERPAPGVEHQRGRVDGLVLTTPDPMDGDDAGIEAPFAGPAERRSWSVGGSGAADHRGPAPGIDRWRPDLPAPAGSPIEVALPLERWGPGPPPVWWVGHDGTRLTSRWTPPL